MDHLVRLCFVALISLPALSSGLSLNHSSYHVVHASEGIEDFSDDEYIQTRQKRSHESYSSCTPTTDCRPLSTCQHYYSTKMNYYDRYRSCLYGYGHRGVCCPRINYEAHQYPIISQVYTPPVVEYSGSPEHLKECIQKAVVEVEQGRYSNDKDLEREENHPSYWGNGVATPLYLEYYKNNIDTGYFLNRVAKCLQKEYGYSYDGVEYDIRKYLAYLPKKYRDVCQYYDSHTDYNCNYNQEYRTYDGSCNNLLYPWYGKANSRIGRIVPPYYYDKLYEPYKTFRGYARTVRFNALPDRNLKHRNINGLFMSFGQMVAHDVTLVPFYQGENGLFLDCCYKFDGEHNVSPKCLTMGVSEHDPFYGKFNEKCLNVARASLAPNQNCQLSYPYQLNIVTHHLDLSSTYGSSEKKNREIRTGYHGLLKMSKIDYEYFLPLSKEAECFERSSDFCPISGDLRTSIQPGIQIFHTVFVRFHNLCAKKLSKLYGYTDDEYIFEKCRKITIAVYQHILYTEYLPLLLGYEFSKEWNLIPVTQGYDYTYLTNYIPWTLGEFNAAAFRLHTIVYGDLHLADYNFYIYKTLDLVEYYNSGKLFENPRNFDDFIRGSMVTDIASMDQYYDRSVSDFLLKDERTVGLDIGTMNIIRSRDYGLGSYFQYRKLCNLPLFDSWEDLKKYMPEEVVTHLQDHYESPYDLDLYVGGIAEYHAYGATIGPTFQCIIGYQFQTWMWADRFFYNKGDMPHSFSLPELDEIRKMSVSNLLCMTTHLDQASVFGFRTINDYNHPVYCSDDELLPYFDFSVFK